MLTIQDGRRTYLVKVLRPEYQFPAVEFKEDQTGAFIRVWRQCEQDFNKPALPFGGKEQVLSRRLVQKYPLDRLRALVVYWYRTSYEPVRERGYHPLLWFVHCIPAIEKEIG